MLTLDQFIQHIFDCCIFIIKEVCNRLLNLIMWFYTCSLHRKAFRKVWITSRNPEPNTIFRCKILRGTACISSRFFFRPVSVANHFDGGNKRTTREYPHELPLYKYGCFYISHLTTHLPLRLPFSLSSRPRSIRPGVIRLTVLSDLPISFAI